MAKRELTASRALDAAARRKCRAAKSPKAAQRPMAGRGSGARYLLTRSLDSESPIAWKASLSSSSVADSKK